MYGLYGIVPMAVNKYFVTIELIIPSLFLKSRQSVRFFKSTFIKFVHYRILVTSSVPLLLHLILTRQTAKTLQENHFSPTFQRT